MKKNIKILGRLPVAKELSKNTIQAFTKKLKSNMKKKIKSDDKKYIWHPFTKLSNEYNPLVISSAYDEKLVDIDGNEYIDLISSWWVNTHGHCRKEIVSAITKQMEKFEQVLFADFTHQPATQLAEMLISILPKNLKKYFILTMDQLL